MSPRRLINRVLWLWDRAWCFFGQHCFGYSPVHDAVLCFACGKWAPLRTWREYMR